MIYSASKQLEFGMKVLRLMQEYEDKGIDRKDLILSLKLLLVSVGLDKKENLR